MGGWEEDDGPGDEGGDKEGGEGVVREGEGSWVASASG